MGHEIGPVMVAEWSALALLFWIVLAAVLRHLRLPGAIVVSAIASWVLAGVLLAYGGSFVGGVDSLTRWVRAVPELTGNIVRL